MAQRFSISNTLAGLLILLVMVGFNADIFAQNTIGGVKVTVPEAEVKKQSQFLEAEKQRLLGNWEKAKEAYKAFVFEFPENDAAWYGLARVYAATNDWINAFEAIAKAVEKSPENQWYPLYQAELFEKNGRNKDALEVYEQLVKRYPDTPEFQEKLAYLALLNENPKRAIKALEKLEQIEGINEKNAAQKHLIYVGMGDHKKAAEVYKNLINTYPKVPKYRYQLAEFYERIGDQANARSIWQATLQQFPNDPMARIALAEQAAGSEAQYLQSIQPLFSDVKVGIDAKVKEIVPFLAKLESNQDPNLTLQLVKLGEILEKTHPDEAKAWSISGDIFYLANRNQEALDRYQKCIELNASVFSVWDNALTILHDQQRFEDMLRIAEKALDLFPNQPKAYWYYAVAANGRKQFNDAITQLNQAILMTGNNPALRADLLDQLGEAYLGKGDKEKARDAWKKAFELSKNPLVEKKLNAL